MTRTLITLLLFAASGCGREPAADAEHEDEHAHGEGESHEEHGAEPSARPGRLRVDPGMLRDLRITTTAAELRPASDTIGALGELQVDEDRYAEVGAPLPARVSQVLAAAGDQVQVGQSLVELDSPEVGRARASWLSAKARMDLAQRTLTRREGLAVEQIVSQRDLDTSRAELSDATAQLAAAEQLVSALGGSGPGASRQATRFTLRAPIAGQVIERNLLRGRMVGPEQSLFVIADLRRLWLVAHTFERDAVRIRTGRSARASFPALPGQEFSGTVTRIGSRVDPASRTIDIRIELDNAAGLLRPGMSATALIPVGDDTQQVVTVPVAAVQRLAEGWCVFLPSPEDGVFETRAIGRGRDLGGEVEILQGVRAGERIVVDGAFLLKAEVEKSRGAGAEHHH